MQFSAAFQCINNNHHRLHCLLWQYMESWNTCTTLCQHTLLLSLGYELLSFGGPQARLTTHCRQFGEKIQTDVQYI